MTLIEGIGDEVVQFFVALFLILIVSIAWWTTRITNEGSLRTVFVLERRRLRATRRLTNHTEAVTIVEGTTTDNTDTGQTTPAMDENKPPDSSDNIETNNELETQSIDDASRIVETMDAPRETDVSNDLRRRRLAFYENNPDEKVSESQDNRASTSEVNSPENSKDAKCVQNEKTKVDEFENIVNTRVSDSICVKLKYLNDELKIVDGRLEEKLGDFKRRHFSVELSSNKLVRLIFNGQVLHQDNETLHSCGLFDNCVVHCLIHQRPVNASSTRENADDRENSSNLLGNNSYSNNNNQPHEWHLENYLFAILCCFLGFAWYLRYVYAHLYTVTATIGLILMTGIFTLIMFAMHYPDNVALNQQQRTENVQSRQ